MSFEQVFADSVQNAKPGPWELLYVPVSKVLDLNNAHQREVTNLQNDHQREITNLQTDHQLEITNLQTDHQREMIEVQREMITLQTDYQREKTSIQNDVTSLKKELVRVQFKQCHFTGRQILEKFAKEVALSHDSSETFCECGMNLTIGKYKDLVLRDVICHLERCKNSQFSPFREVFSNIYGSDMARNLQPMDQGMYQILINFLKSISFEIHDHINLTSCDRLSVPYNCHKYFRRLIAAIFIAYGFDPVYYTEDGEELPIENELNPEYINNANKENIGHSVNRIVSISIHKFTNQL